MDTEELEEFFRKMPGRREARQAEALGCAEGGAVWGAEHVLLIDCVWIASFIPLLRTVVFEPHCQRDGWVTGGF